MGTEWVPVPEGFDADAFDWLDARCPRCGDVLFSFTDRRLVGQVLCSRRRCRWRGLVRGPDAPTAAELTAAESYWDDFLKPGEGREVAEAVPPDTPSV